MAVHAEGASTRERLLDVATRAFAQRGFEATSLDDLAGEVGVRKQTLLYYHPSKDALLDAVIVAAADELSQVLGAVLVAPAAPRVGSAVPSRDGALVDAVFRLGARRPELLDLLREVLRLGEPAASTLIRALGPLVDQLTAAIAGVDDRRARRMVLTASAMVVGMATEVEVLRSLGVEPSIADLRRRRATLLGYLRGVESGHHP